MCGSLNVVDSEVSPDSDGFWGVSEGVEGGSAAGVEDYRFFEEPEGGCEEAWASQEAAAGGLSVSLGFACARFRVSVLISPRF
jgi:hypothetical protein